MSPTPLVSVICLCHNQRSYVLEALESVINQTYPHVELIVVDDASADGSPEVIRQFLASHPEVRFMPLAENLGNCRAFNRGFEHAQGAYIIDLAADDVLLPRRIEIGLADFATHPTAGVHFTDAFFIDRHGSVTGTHYHRDKDGRLTGEVPGGDVYEPLIRKYFISPPTLMIRREVLETLGGYDESLAYEDFDFWIRSAREYRYVFNKAPLVKRRIVKNSLSSRQFKWRNRHQYSTYNVCRKILELNRARKEHQALITRCNYEIRQCVKTMNFGLIFRYLKLKKKARNQII